MTVVGEDEIFSYALIEMCRRLKAPAQNWNNVPADYLRFGFIFLSFFSLADKRIGTRPEATAR